MPQAQKNIPKISERRLQEVTLKLFKNSQWKNNIKLEEFLIRSIKGKPLKDKNVIVEEKIKKKLQTTNEKREIVLKTEIQKQRLESLNSKEFGGIDEEISNGQIANNKIEIQMKESSPLRLTHGNLNRTNKKPQVKEDEQNGIKDMRVNDDSYTNRSQNVQLEQQNIESKLSKNTGFPQSLLFCFASKSRHKRNLSNKQ